MTEKVLMQEPDRPCEEKAPMQKPGGPCEVKATLDELGKQYAVEADNLDAMITACRERRRFAMQGGDSAEAQRQERLMEMHAQQRGDLLRLSVWLRHYYQNAGENQKGGLRYAEHHSCVA